MINDENFDELYHQHKNLVYNMCLHYVLNAEDAQDITQEVFVKVHMKYHQYDASAASVQTWICRIAINHSLDFLKAQKTKNRFGFITSLFRNDNDEPINETLHFDHPGVALEEKEGVQNLLKIIYALPESQKTAIVLSKIEDRPQKEVAEIMDTSVKAVESLIQRANQNIQKKLTENEGL